MLNQDNIVIDMNMHDEQGNVVGTTKATVMREHLEQVFNQAALVAMFSANGQQDKLANAVEALEEIVSDATLNSIKQ